MATPTKKQQKAAEKVGSKALKMVKSIDRSAIAPGLSSDQVRDIFKTQGPKQKDVDTVVTAIKALYRGKDKFEAMTMKEVYLLLVQIRRYGMNLLKEEYQKSFAKFLMVECERNRSTAYKDVKIVDIIIEWDLEPLLTNDTVKDLLFKLRELSSKDFEIQKMLLEDIENVTREQIAQHANKERSKWDDFTTFSGRYRRNKDGILNIDLKDPELEDDLLWILKRLDRKKVKEVKELLK